MKWLSAVLIGIFAGVCAANEISGSIKAGVTITHAGSSSASSLSESIADPWKWGTSTAIIGTNGSATGLTKLYVTSASIVGSGTNAMDLYGSLTDSFGTTLNFAKVKLLFIAPSNSTCTLRSAAANGFTNWVNAVSAGVTVRSGGAFLLAAPDATGYPVSNGVYDALEIVNETTNAATVKIIVAGE